jgi:hypothetical protein
MRKPNFIETLATKLSIYLDSIPYINGGGCGIVALTLYRELKKYNDNVKIIQVTYGFHQFIHFVIKVNGVYIHSDGIFANNSEELNFNAQKTYHTDCDFCDIEEKYLENLLKDKSLWNSYFDREKYEKVIKKAIKKTVEQTIKQEFD